MQPDPAADMLPQPRRNLSPRVGQQLERYRLVRLLGQGAFGGVYLAENIYRNTQVAIKILNIRLTNEEIPPFLNEARNFRLKHPHIIPIIDFGMDPASSTPFLVMDYAPGGTLRQLHPKGSQISLVTVVDYVKQVAAALQYAHEEHLVHRDVKPENMLIGWQQEVLLSDFGVSVIFQTGRTSLQPSSYRIGGTPYYMAPEQFQGKPSPASDQYALAIVVYEWLTGTLPFTEGDFIQLGYQHNFETPPLLRNKVSTILPAAEQVVLTALAKDPKQRFASVQDFSHALEQTSQVALSHPITLSSQTTSRVGQDVQDQGQDEEFISTAPHQTPPALLTQEPATVAVTSPHPHSGRSRTAIILVGLALLLVLASVVLYSSRGIFLPAPSFTTNTHNPQAHHTATAEVTATPTTQAFLEATAPAQAIATLNAVSSNPYPPYNGRLVVNDPLRDTTDGWSVSDTEVKCFFAQGAYHIRGGAQSSSAFCNYTSGPLANFVYQIQIKFVTTDTCGGVVFRETPLSMNFLSSYYNFHICTNGVYQLTVVGNPPIDRYLGQDTSPAILTAIGKANIIAVVANGPSLTIYVNGVQITHVEDTTSSTGTIGVMVSRLLNSKVSGEVAFNDAKVWTL